MLTTRVDKTNNKQIFANAIYIVIVAKNQNDKILKSIGDPL